MEELEPIAAELTDIQYLEQVSQLVTPPNAESAL